EEEEEEEDPPKGMWMRKTVRGERMYVRRRWWRNRKLKRRNRAKRIIMRTTNDEEVHLTKLHYVIDGKKSEKLIEAEKKAARAKDVLDNAVIDVDSSHVPITKEILDRWTECQIASEEAKEELAIHQICENDKENLEKGAEFLVENVAAIVEEEAEIEKMIEEKERHERSIAHYREIVESMSENATMKNQRIALDEISIELNEAIANERRILEDYVTLLQTMDSKRYKELVRLWAFDIDEDDNAESVAEKRLARVRQFILQKPVGGPKHWENQNAYVDEWEEKNEIPKKSFVCKVMGPEAPFYRGEKDRKRAGCLINENGFPVRLRKPEHFKPLTDDPEWLDESDIDDMCDSNLDERHEINLEMRKKLADRSNEDFEKRQRIVVERGQKARRELMKKYKKTEANMPAPGAGLQRTYDQDSIFDPIPIVESYWSQQRRVKPELNLLLKKRLENTREMFASVVQPMYRTILVLRETKRRLNGEFNDKKTKDGEEESRKRRLDSDEEEESEEDEEEEEEEE
ncbi:hypothetical protein PFISCL1PPCAC_27127, partial [Pristionchus fissidentatus]